ncbi:MAG TPA: hypothetical protein IAC53_01755 [Candidatus Fimenecus excrementigallinarum]|uniref:Uncharacterized protein n=1 Tax=Candidatus Fimenecus excrementigallinarum TaxID=2840816 RepID=A0A9D1LD51_9FIRM|nr:hypothetical protein [Candidatus Fimenecus excrementigallinarum]
MKTRGKVWKRVTAVALAVIMVAVSLPLALAAGDGTYDPAPQFEDESALWAWMTEEGTVRVSIPQARVAVPNRGSAWTADAASGIARYIVRLYDLGSTTAHHKDPMTDSTVPTAEMILDTSTALTLSENGTIEVEFTAADLQGATNGGITLNSTNRFNVNVYAQDSEGWVSSPISTLVSDVPRFTGEGEYTPVVENETGIREILTFEGRNNDTANYVSSNGATDPSQIGSHTENGNGMGTASEGEHEGVGYANWNDGALDYKASSTTGTNQLRFRGQTIAGGEGGSGAYSFYVTGAGQQSFVTTWSRQHWKGENAEEVWYWFDFSQVSVNGLAFELNTSGKRYVEEYYSNAFESVQSTPTYLCATGDENYSPYTFSTAGYTGDDGYVLIQGDDGSWQKVSLEDGRVDLSHYKGYIRVPTKFICSTEDSYVTVRNDNFGQAGTAWRDDNGAAFRDASLFNEPVLVDKAGTPITSAYLLQYRFFRFSVGDGWFNPNDYYNYFPQNEWGYPMLATGWNKADCATNREDANKAYIEVDENGEPVYNADGTVKIGNADAGYRAIDDLFGAGFSYESMSDDSVNKSFYLDSVMLYKTEGTYPGDMSADLDAHPEGWPLTNYYDQRTEIPRQILETIDELITTPDLGDYRAVQYIAEMLQAYRDGYKDFLAAEEAAGRRNFLSDDGLAAVAAELGMASVWEKFITARTLCDAAGTLDYDENTGAYTFTASNAPNSPLTAELAARLEKLPDPSEVSSVNDDAFANEIRELYQIYRRLNLQQLDALSYAEEEKLLGYVGLVSGAADNDLAVVSDLLASNKFVLFNDFDSDNVTLGQLSERIENSPDPYKRGDYRFTQGFLTYTTTANDYLGAIDNSPVEDVTDPMQADASEYPHDFIHNATAATISASGFNGTNGAVVNINGAHYNDAGDNNASTSNGVYNILSVSRDSYTALDWGDSAEHGLTDVDNLGAAAEGNGNWSDEFMLGLVFYADFTQLKNFKLSATITTNVWGADNAGGANDYVLAMGDIGSDKTYFLMDMEQGNWVEVSSGNHGENYFNSTTVGTGTNLKLEGYRGFVMLPLYQFKDNWDNGSAAVKLSEWAPALNTITRVSIGVAPLNNENDAAAMVGQSFIIDNIGFGYAEDGYNTGSTEHPAFDEVFGVKSTAAQQFERDVAAVEPLAGAAALITATTTLENQYAALSDYQKNQPSVKQAYDRLQVLKGYITDPPVTEDVSTFIDFVTNLPDAVKTASVTGEQDLPYPGVRDTSGDGIADEPRYDLYGFESMEQVQAVIDWREDYNLYTADSVAAVSADYLTAFRAASRIMELQSFIDEGKAFVMGAAGADGALSGGLFGNADAVYLSLSEIYQNGVESNLGAADGNVHPAANTNEATDYRYRYDSNTTTWLGNPYGTWKDAGGATVDEGSFISVSADSRGKLQDLYTDQYSDNMSFYAKHLLSEGQLVSFGGETIGEVAQAVRDLLNNTDEQFTNGTTLPGLSGLIAEYEAVAESVEKKLAAGETLTDDDRATIDTYIAKYEELAPKYHDVAQLYDAVQKLYDLFPTMNGVLTGDAAVVTPAAAGNAAEVTVTMTGADLGAESVSAEFAFDVTQLEAYIGDTDAKVTFKGVAYSDDTAWLTDEGTQMLQYAISAADGASAALGGSITLTATVYNPSFIEKTPTDSAELTFTYEYLDRNGIKRAEDITIPVTVKFLADVDEFYSVAVPASVNIPWDTQGAYDVKVTGTADAPAAENNGYLVDYVLAAGHTLTVSAAADNEGAMTRTGGDETLTYTLTGGAAQEFTGAGADVTAADENAMQVTVTGWDGVPLDTYTGSMTYTAEFDTGAASTP